LLLLCPGRLLWAALLQLLVSHPAFLTVYRFIDLEINR